MNDPLTFVDRLPPPDRLALFLDIDGTLIGLRHEDRDAGVLAGRVDTLRRVAALTGDATAILTGRTIEKVDELLAPLELPIGGLQGADRRFPGGKRTMPVLTADERRMFEVIAEDVSQLFPHVEIEWKPAGMALVYDEGDPAVGQLHALAIDRVEDCFKVMRGRVAIDIVPLHADKGQALDAFMAHETFANRIPVHIGDDTPDEPAFAASQRVGGFGVTVGRPVAGIELHLADHHATWLLLSAYLDRYGN